MVTLNQSELLPNTQTVQKNANVNGAIKKHTQSFGGEPIFQKKQGQQKFKVWRKEAYPENVHMFCIAPL